ncbi:hypothetical protein RHMOL_Rhmol11G0039400 [Rhododendron molle]|uniref:Uncharacterized protein n=1 Tax=Rhododendron molle TaxID=49168 RepID=A0ACC0LN66_RHOML|nr:hypothetical protein RHMOL_Rhmol11G0039400 [Rhododendron molle]
MSMSDSDTSSQGSEYRNFRQLTRDRLLYEMLRSTKSGDSKSTWKVLVMDRVTVKIMSYACKMADITEEGVSLVEDIYRRRQPLPTMDAIYFMQPTKENVIMFLSDMTGRAPLYKKAFVFFSSPVPRELVSHIKKDGSVLARIGALREMNLEYFAIDSQNEKNSPAIVTVHLSSKQLLPTVPEPDCSVSRQKHLTSPHSSCPPNINDNHRTISSLVHQLDIRRALNYDGIPGVTGTGLGQAARVLLDYHPTSGYSHLSLRLFCLTRHVLPPKPHGHGCSFRFPSSASHCSTLAGRATTSGSPSIGLLVDARRKRSHQDAFGGEDNEDKLSLCKFQELNVAFARTPAPLPASQLALSSSSSSPLGPGIPLR